MNLKNKLNTHMEQTEHHHDVDEPWGKCRLLCEEHTEEDRHHYKYNQEYKSYNI